ncbi:urease accessory protein UreF [bacterium]|nr:urease accessory protein UreF [bacterium]
MTTIPELMRVLQFGDSLLPVGSFSFSNGLESAVQLGIVHDVESLREFVRTASKQAATGDGIALLVAFRAARAGDDAILDQADRAIFNRKLAEEMRTMTVRMGRKLAEMSQRVIGCPISERWLKRIREGSTPGCYPVAQAVTFASLGLSEQDAFAVHQYGLAGMMVGASLRLMKIHYLDAQAVLFDVNQDAESAYERIANADLEQMSGFAPILDLAASVHVRSHVRMFMN